MRRGAAILCEKLRKRSKPNGRRPARAPFTRARFPTGMRHDPPRLSLYFRHTTMTQSTTGLVEIKGWLANSPAGPWSYRPDEFDDWGIVKCAPDDEGRKFVICQARGEPFDEGSLNQHRRDKTDPWEAPAKLIAAVPEMIDLLSTQETTIAELVAALEKAPIPGRQEPMDRFRERSDAWLAGPYKTALTKSRSAL